MLVAMAKYSPLCVVGDYFMTCTVKVEKVKNWFAAGLPGGEEDSSDTPRSVCDFWLRMFQGWFLIDAIPVGKVKVSKSINQNAVFKNQNWLILRLDCDLRKKNSCKYFQDGVGGSWGERWDVIGWWHQRSEIKKSMKTCRIFSNFFLE